MGRNLLISFVFLIGVTSLAYSAQPLDSLQGSMERCIDILKDPEYHEAAQKDRQRQKMWEVFREVFDFTELAKRTVGSNWRIFTPAQKKEFTDAFAEFLGNIYLDEMDRKLNGGKVIYWGEEMITDSMALVKTKILTEIAEIPVDYRMRKHNGTWRVYDVNILGVSLVKNYRAQFQHILSKESPDHLIEKLKEKIKKP